MQFEAVSGWGKQYVISAILHLTFTSLAYKNGMGLLSLSFSTDLGLCNYHQGRAWKVKDDDGFPAGFLSSWGVTWGSHLFLHQLQHPSTEQPGWGGRQRAGISQFATGYGNLWASSESDTWICFFWVVSPPWPRRPGQHLPLPAMASFTAPVGSIISHPPSTVPNVLQPSFTQRLLRFWKLQYFFCSKNATVYLCSHFQVHWHVWWVDLALTCLVTCLSMITSNPYHASGCLPQCRRFKI